MTRTFRSTANSRSRCVGADDMATKTCGCLTETCGCCEGAQSLTPVSTANRLGLGALRYSVGTHGAFFETMKARLATMTVEAPGADRQTLETFQPLRGLTTRDPSDPAVALLDSWAAVSDVLTFYQERIANEGYLRTATDGARSLNSPGWSVIRCGPASRRQFSWPTRWKTSRLILSKFPSVPARRAFRVQVNCRNRSKPAKS